jgi:hypothetical protein
MRTSVHVPDSEPGTRALGWLASIRQAAMLDCQNPRWEPYAGKLQVRVWAGGARQLASLPRLSFLLQLLTSGYGTDRRSTSARRMPGIGGAADLRTSRRGRLRPNPADSPSIVPSDGVRDRWQVGNVRFANMRRRKTPDRVRVHCEHGRPRPCHCSSSQMMQR